jgi:hypothetical protein
MLMDWTEFLKALREINQYGFLVTAGAVCYCVVVTIGWKTIIQKRLLLALSLYPLNGVWGTNRAVAYDAPVSSSALTTFLVNLIVIGVCCTIRKPKDDKARHRSPQA